MRAIPSGLLSAVSLGIILLRTAAGVAAQPALPQPAAPAPAVPAPQDVPYPGHIVLAVDTSNIAQGIFTVHETIPVPQGAPLTLLYPQWRPGNHSPTGHSRLARIAGLAITADGRPIAWTRDPVNVFGLFNFPAIVGKDQPLSDRIFVWHLICGILIGAIVALHVAGALYHWLIKGDRVLQRVLPGN